MTFFTATYRTFKRELKRIVRHPVYVMLMLVFPILAFTFFGLFFSRGVANDMSVAVIDRDQSTLSRKLVGMIDATPSCKVTYNLQDLEEAATLIRQGRIEAAVYIPDHFESDIFGNRGTGVEAYVNGANLTVNGLVGKDIQSAVTFFSSGIQLQILMKSGLSEAQAYAQIMPVKFDKHVLFNPYTNYGYYLMPSFMPLLLAVFTLLLTIYVIGRELKFGTSGVWLKTAGGSPFAALVGKMLPYTVTMCIMSLFMSNIMHKWLDVPQNGSTIILVLSGFLVVLCYQAIGVFIVTLLSNLRLSLSIGGGYSVLAFSFSGLTFPAMAMDRWIEILTHIFPFTFFTEIFVDQAMRGAPVAYTLPFLGWMSIPLILPLLCLPRLKKIATNPHFWGRM